MYIQCHKFSKINKRMQIVLNVIHGNLVVFYINLYGGISLIHILSN